MKDVMLDSVDFTVIGWFRQRGININFRNQNVIWHPELVSVDLRNKTLREVLVDLGKFYEYSIFVYVDKNEASYVFTSYLAMTNKKLLREIRLLDSRKKRLSD